MKSIFKIPLLLVMLLLPYLSISQCRGTQPGELYFSLAWYYDIGTDIQYDMIARTTDYGQTLEMLYLYEHGTAEMPVGWVMADATPGVLYNQLEEGIYRSFNNAQTWEFVQPLSSQYEIYVTGNMLNEMFRKTQGVLYKTIDNGENWSYQQNELIGDLEIGNQQGEIYVIEAYDNEQINMILHHSMDDGINYDSFIVNTTITGYKVSGNTPRVSRGTIPGELYLVTWWPPANYKIFRSTDYGETFTLKYEQPDTCYFWDEVFQFTAGRAPCEFYILKIKTWIDGYYNRLHIYYSNDCAQSFTEYIHVLDENWTDILEEKQKNDFTISNSPNPCIGQTIFDIPGYEKYNNPAIEIFNIQGRLIKKLQIQQNRISFKTSGLPSGTYFYRLRTDQGYSETNKIIIIQ